MTCPGVSGEHLTISPLAVPSTLPTAVSRPEGARMLFVGDDWAEDHHDVEVQDETGRRLARARLPEGIVGLSTLHELITEHLGEADVDPETGFVGQSVTIGIETDRGTWVSALAAAGYQVFALNPVQVARYRERHGSSGAKSDRGDAHVLAEIVRLDRAHYRPIAGDSPEHWVPGDARRGDTGRGDTGRGDTGRGDTGRGDTYIARLAQERDEIGPRLSQERGAGLAGPQPKGNGRADRKSATVNDGWSLRSS